MLKFAEKVGENGVLREYMPKMEATKCTCYKSKEAEIKYIIHENIKSIMKNYSRISMNIFFQNTDNISKNKRLFQYLKRKNIQQILSDELLI